jgi:hypothetical protein
MRILGLALSVALTAAQPTEPNAHPAVGLSGRAARGSVAPRKMACRSRRGFESALKVSDIDSERLLLRIDRARAATAKGYATLGFRLF